MKNSTERFAEAFTRARQHWKRHQAGEVLTLPAAGSQKAFTIAVSREAGAGGAAVAQAVAARIDWPVYDRELIEKVASDTGLHTELLESLDEKQVSWHASWLASFGGSAAISSIKFARHLTETIAALAALGHCIIVGRGAAVVLPETTTLRVRLVAPLQVRIARTQEKSGLTKDEAARRVKELDAARSEFVRSHFLKDAGEVHQYDLVLNTGRFSTAQCADLIVAALRQIESSATN